MTTKFVLNFAKKVFHLHSDSYKTSAKYMYCYQMLANTLCFIKCCSVNISCHILNSCHVGDLVLLCLDERLDHYVVFTVGTTLHFLHTDCLTSLGLKPSKYCTSPTFRLDHYVVFTVGTTLHFLHTDCLTSLGLKPSMSFNDSKFFKLADVL